MPVEAGWREVYAHSQSFCGAVTVQGRKPTSWEEACRGGSEVTVNLTESVFSG